MRERMTEHLRLFQVIIDCHRYSRLSQIVKVNTFLTRMSPIFKMVSDCQGFPCNVNFLCCLGRT